MKEDLLRVRVDKEERSDRLREEEHALKECVASLKGRVETLVKRERAYMGMGRGGEVQGDVREGE